MTRKQSRAAQVAQAMVWRRWRAGKIVEWERYPPCPKCLRWWDCWTVPHRGRVESPMSRPHQERIWALREQGDAVVNCAT